MSITTETDVIIIGGGQAALATAYFLKRNRLSFIILDDSRRQAVPGYIHGILCDCFHRIAGFPYRAG